MVEDQAVAFLVYGRRGFRAQLGQQLRSEQGARKAQALELLRIHQSPGTIVLEDELVLRHHFLAQHALGIWKAVADDLEDDIEGGQGEAHHHQTTLAGGVHELVLGLLKVTHELPVALSLALLRTAQHGEQLAHRLARHDRFQEQHRLGHPLQIDVEIGLGEAEDDADVGLGEHDGIDENSRIGVFQRDDERHGQVASDDPPDDVGARHLIEHRADDFDPEHRARHGAIVQVAGHLGRDVRDAVVEVAPRRMEADIAEQVLEQQIQRAVVEVHVGADRARDAGQRIEAGRNELDPGSHADRAEQLPRDGAEESLGELGVRQRLDQAGEAVPNLRPQVAVERPLAKLFAQLGNRPHAPVGHTARCARTASRWLPFQSRASKRAGARRVMARNSAL